MSLGSLSTKSTINISYSVITMSQILYSNLLNYFRFYLKWRRQFFLYWAPPLSAHNSWCELVWRQELSTESRSPHATAGTQNWLPSRVCNSNKHKEKQPRSESRHSYWNLWASQANHCAKISPFLKHNTTLTTSSLRELNLGLHCTKRKWLQHLSLHMPFIEPDEWLSI